MKKSIIVKVLSVVLAASVFLTPISTVHVQAAKLTPEQKQERSYANKFARWCRTQANKIRNADANKKLTISTGTTGYSAFNGDVFEALKERPDVQLTVKWKYEGLDFKFVIPAGTDVTQVFDEHGYAGFLYLQEFFGEKGTTKKAKAIKTVSTKEAADAAKARKQALAVEVADIDEVANEMLKQAYDYIIEQGMDPAEAELTAKNALPGLLVQIGFDAEDAAIASETATLPAPADANLLAEQLAQHAFEQFIASGMNTEEALAATQAALPELLKQAGF